MLNKVILIGHLGDDPEVGATANGQGMPFAKFNLATSERWRDKRSGERKERTEWHRVVVFGDALSAFCDQYLKKGSKVWIEGQLKTRNWTDRDGIKRYATEVVLQQFGGSIKFLDRREGGVPNPESPDDYDYDNDRAAA